MATRTCPSCGTQYVATVRSCIDCGEVLVGETTSVRSAEAKSTATVGDREFVGYELPGWGNQLKVALEGMLEREGVPRSWEAAVLRVPAEFESEVDRLIEVVEGTDLPEPDDEAPQVALEIEGLDADTYDELNRRLIAGSVAHAWNDEGDLLVAEADEARVLELIDAAFEGADTGGGDDVDVQAVLSRLYVAVDRLMHRPDDHKRIDAYREAAEPLDGLGVPYGFEPAVWEEITGATAGLLALLDDPEDEDAEDEDAPEDDDAEDEDEPEEDEEVSPVERAARTLRERLRQLV